MLKPRSDIDESQVATDRRAATVPALDEPWRSELVWVGELVCRALCRPWGRWLYHWPNETPGFTEAAKKSRQGMQRGAPDYLLLVAQMPHQGAFLELKRRKAPPSSVDVPQREFLEQAQRCGFAVHVARGADEAMEWLECYVSGGELSTWSRWWER